MKRKTPADYVLQVLVGVLAVIGAAHVVGLSYDAVARGVNEYIDGRARAQVWELRGEMWSALQALHPNRVSCGRHGCSVIDR